MESSGEDLDPILSENEFKEIVELLFCHGLHKNLHTLLLKIVKKFPDIEQEFSSPHRQALILLAYCHKFQLNGPLPEIRHYKFLWNLHQSVVGVLKADSTWVNTIPQLVVYKLVGGLRCLITRSILLRPKFIPKDVESAIASYFPTLPVVPGNSRAWENWSDILKLDIEDKSQALKDVNELNRMNVSHLTEKLNKLAFERKKSGLEHDESVIIVWESVAPKLDAFLRHLRNLLPEGFLDRIASHSHPKMKILSKRIQSGANEEEVIKFFFYICDLHTESQFWTSNFVMSKVSGI